MKARNILTVLLLLAVCAGTCTICSCSKDDTEENGPSGNGGGNNSSGNAVEDLDIIVTVTDEGITPKGTIFTAVNDKTFFVNFIKYTVKEGHLVVSGYDETGLKSINGAAKIVSMINYKGIPYQVLEIGEKAFYRSSDLTSITIPNMIRNIESSAFYGCTSLTDVYCLATTQPIAYIYNGAGSYPAFDLSYTKEHTTLHVPAGSIESYSATYPWNSFKNIVAIE